MDDIAGHTMTSIVVYCGNGGDWEFECDRVYWRQWIGTNIPHCKFISSGCDIGFSITAHQQADKAIVHFYHSESALVFCLTSPEYISSNKL
jgi:hypothetical protein